MSYFSHCVQFAKEDGQGLTGGHLSLLFPTSDGRGGSDEKGMSPPHPSHPPLLTKGRDSWSHRPRPAFLLSSKRPGRFIKTGTDKIPGRFAYFRPPPLFSNFPLVSSPAPSFSFTSKRRFCCNSSYMRAPVLTCLPMIFLIFTAVSPPTHTPPHGVAGHSLVDLLLKCLISFRRDVVGGGTLGMFDFLCSQPFAVARERTRV